MEVLKTRGIWDILLLEEINDNFFIGQAQKVLKRQRLIENADETRQRE